LVVFTGMAEALPMAWAKKQGRGGHARLQEKGVFMPNSKTGKVALTPVDGVEVLVVIDNYSDVLLPSQGPAQRPPLAAGGEIPRDTLLAEHGLSLLITARTSEQESRVLLDAGYSAVGVPHNLDRLGVSLKGLEAVVLSHGHMDHYGALTEVLRRVGAPLPLVLHPAAASGKRYLNHPVAGTKRFPSLPLDEFTGAGAEPVWAEEPYLGRGGLWAASGEVSRTTDFETGMPGATRDDGAGQVPDPLADDMCLILNLQDKGLVVISGCAHSGIVNTVRHAKALTGVDQVYAVIGGFHLTGPVFEPIIGRTITELEALAPQVVMPMHCSGHRAQVALEAAMGERYVLSSVGTVLRL
jgi:7,8-dihydropterin-6-yl-methyl-4-(beta-D-ribofuranosyl)aminobenzene 5'-phosphate synthase